MTSAIHISFPPYSWMLIPLIIFCGFFVYWIYRRTVPEINHGLRALFIALRTLVIIFLLVLIFNPDFIFKNEREKKPGLALLIDGSASMNYKDGSGIRPEVIEGLLDEDNTKMLEEGYSIDYFSFSDSLTALDNLKNLTYNGTSSDIANALSHIYDKGSGSYSTILLVTDGAYNVGADPVRISKSGPIPVFTVGIGDSISGQDFGIAEIITNPVVYAGDSLRVQAVVTGFKNAATALRLKDENNKTIAVKKISFDESGGEEKAELVILPGDAGLKRYSFKLDSLSGESNLDNNERHFSVKVLPRKIEVLLMAGAPSPDFAFLKRLLDRNPDIELTTLIERNKQEFYHGRNYDNLKDRDVIILLNYPTAGSDKKVLSAVLNKISSGTSVLIIPGVDFQGEDLNEIKNSLPVIFNRSGAEQQRMRIFPNESVSPLTEFFREEYISSDLPPLTSADNIVDFNDFTTIAARFENGFPAIGFSVRNGVKAAGCAVYDFWRFSLQDQDHALSDSLITHFWYNLIRWLSTREDDDLFRLSTGKDIFSSGEKIPFSAALYDKSFLPVDDAEIMVKIKGTEGDTEIKLNKTGEGQYYNSTRLFAEGDYLVEGYAVLDRDTLKYSGGFIVERFNPEYLNPALRTDVLRGIAQNSGGEFYTPGVFDQFFEDFKPEPERYLSKSEFRFFPRWISVIAIVLLLAVEWIIRKRKGML